MITEATTLQYHRTLNPKIWDQETIKPEIEAHLIDIANRWIEFAKIKPEDIRDITMTGGNCNYNYTDQSDIDVHVIVDYSSVAEDKSLVKDYYMSKKSLWADRHPDISVAGYPVELFAQDSADHPHPGQGVYSLTNQKWIQSPEHLGLDLENDLGVEYSSAEFANRINSTVNFDRGLDMAQALMDEIYGMRGNGIAKEGEFSKGTLIFKDLRNRGLLDKLNKYILKTQDKQLSI